MGEREREEKKDFRGGRERKRGIEREGSRERVCVCVRGRETERE